MKYSQHAATQIVKDLNYLYIMLLRGNIVCALHNAHCNNGLSRICMVLAMYLNLGLQEIVCKLNCADNNVYH